jgi:anti-sigma factor RsiW
MKCPIETEENAELLLAYCTRKLDAESAAVLERHIAICPACREFADGQKALWEALDAWEAAPVSADFDRRLYRRIDEEVPWWSRLLRPVRPMLVRQGLPVAAAAFVVVMAGALLQGPAGAPPAAKTESAQLESVQPEQVERALDAMQMLSEFNHQVRAAGAESPM